MAKKLMTHCSTEMTCRCFSILDLQGQKAPDGSCRAERMLEPVPLREPEYAARMVFISESSWMERVPEEKAHTDTQMFACCQDDKVQLYSSSDTAAFNCSRLEWPAGI